MTFREWLEHNAKKEYNSFDEIRQELEEVDTTGLYSIYAVRDFWERKCEELFKQIVDLKKEIHGNENYQE